MRRAHRRARPSHALLALSAGGMPSAPSSATLPPRPWSSSQLRPDEISNACPYNTRYTLLRGAGLVIPSAENIAKEIAKAAIVAAVIVAAKPAATIAAVVVAAIVAVIVALTVIATPAPASPAAVGLCLAAFVITRQPLAARVAGSLEPRVAPGVSLLLLPLLLPLLSIIGPRFVLLAEVELVIRGVG